MANKRTTKTQASQARYSDPATIPDYIDRQRVEVGPLWFMDRTEVWNCKEVEEWLRPKDDRTPEQQQQDSDTKRQHYRSLLATLIPLLTPRQQQILTLMLEGLGQAAIAQRLGCDQSNISLAWNGQAVGNKHHGGILTKLRALAKIGNVRRRCRLCGKTKHLGCFYHKEGQYRRVCKECSPYQRRKRVAA